MTASSLSLTAEASMPTSHTDFARPVDHTVAPSSLGRRAEDLRREDSERVLSRIEAGAFDRPVTPASLALHARQVAAQPGASTSFSSAPGLPDVMRPAGFVEDVDRTLHQPFPTPAVAAVPAPAPLPGTVPATVYDPWKPQQHFPAPAPVTPARPVIPGPGTALDAQHGAAQLAIVARARGRLDRARIYAAQIGAHAAELRGKLDAAARLRASTAAGGTEADDAAMGPLRGELVECDRQHRQALAILAEVEAEHGRHEADATALFGSDGAAREKLAGAHAARALAREAADGVKAILDRAEAHARVVAGKLDAARSAEADHDETAAARLRAALTDGDAPPAAVEPLVRVSGALEEDMRAARTAADALRVEYGARAAELAAADLKVKGAVDEVLLAEAEAISLECQAADARALALRARLYAYANRTPGDYVRPQPKPHRLAANGMYEPDPASAALAMAPAPRLRQTPVIAAALAAAPAPQWNAPAHLGRTAEDEMWSAFAAALAADPRAETAFADGPVSPLPASTAA